MAKVLGLKQLLQKQYMFLPVLPEEIKASFGQLVDNFTMIIWGNSGNGKSNFLMQFLKCIMPYGKVLYVGLEEGFEATMQLTVMRNLSEDEHAGKIEFADHEMNYNELIKKLSKKKSPKFIIIDSLQYFKINYEQYIALKEKFKKKTFIFISHAAGKEPLGKAASDIRYDVGIKVFVKGYIAFPQCRYGGNKPFIIWEQGARNYWGDSFEKVAHGLSSTKQTKTKDDNSSKKNKEESQVENSQAQEDTPLFED